MIHTPALIQFGFRYNLDKTITEPVYKKLYIDCLNSFDSQMNVSISLSGNTTMEYSRLGSSIKSSIDGDINMILINHFLNNKVAPLSDVLNIIKINHSKHSFKIIKGIKHPTNSEFEMELTFISVDLTLLGTLNDKYIVSIGDQSKNLLNSTPIGTFKIKDNDNIWINSYLKI